MSEIVHLTDTLRIRRINPMNVTVEKLVHNDEKGTDNWSQFNGGGNGPFLADEASACAWVLDHGLLDEGGETDLAGAVDQYRRAAKRIEVAVRKAMA